MLCPDCIVEDPVITFYGPDGQRYQDLARHRMAHDREDLRGVRGVCIGWIRHLPVHAHGVNGYTSQEPFVIGAGG